MRELVTALCLLLFLVSNQAEAGEKTVVGYYPAWVEDELPPEEVRFDVFTHVIYAFAWPDSAGNLERYGGDVHTRLIETAHKKGCEVAVSIGGGGQSDAFPHLTADPFRRGAFAETIATFCIDNGFDGVDFDWEFPETRDERDNYALLVREVREVLSRVNRPFTLSMAIGAASWPSLGNDYADLADVVDWFMVMTYNYAGSWSPVAGHHAPLYPRSDLGYGLSVSRTVEYLLETKGYPSDTILLGLPFYGRSFDAPGLYEDGSGGQSLWYTAIAGLAGRDDWHIRWDETAQAPYLVNDDGTKLVTYDNPQSVRLKCEYAVDHDLGGVGVWALGYDASGGGQPLVDTIGAVFGDVFVEDDVLPVTPSSVALAGNYPNPFNPSTTIDMMLHSKGRCEVEIFNVAGQRVATLADEILSRGRHTFEWCPDTLPAGVYICRIASNGHTATHKMTLIK